MLTLLLYVLIVGLVAILLFLLASVIFGRGEQLSPLPEGTTETVLPAHGVNGADVRALRFQQVLRGYRMGDVDWALARVAARLDELEAILADLRLAEAACPPAGAEAAPATQSRPTVDGVTNAASNDAVTNAASNTGSPTDAESEELRRTE